MRSTRRSRLIAEERAAVVKGMGLRFLCLDCGADTNKNEQYYTLRNGIWRSINHKRDGMLCLHCAERRLHRPLTSADFSDAPINAKQAGKCQELANRLLRPSLPTLRTRRSQPRQRALRLTSRR